MSREGRVPCLGIGEHGLTPAATAACSSIRSARGVCERHGAQYGRAACWDAACCSIGIASRAIAVPRSPWRKQARFGAGGRPTASAQRADRESGQAPAGAIRSVCLLKHVGPGVGGCPAPCSEFPRAPRIPAGQSMSIQEWTVGSAHVTSSNGIDPSRSRPGSQAGQRRGAFVSYGARPARATSALLARVSGFTNIQLDHSRSQAFDSGSFRRHQRRRQCNHSRRTASALARHRGVISAIPRDTLGCAWARALLRACRAFIVNPLDAAWRAGMGRATSP